MPINLHTTGILGRDAFKAGPVVALHIAAPGEKVGGWRHRLVHKIHMLSKLAINKVVNTKVRGVKSICIKKFSTGSYLPQIKSTVIFTFSGGIPAGKMLIDWC